MIFMHFSSIFLFMDNTNLPGDGDLFVRCCTVCTVVADEADEEPSWREGGRSVVLEVIFILRNIITSDNLNSNTLYNCES